MSRLCRLCLVVPFLSFTFSISAQEVLQGEVWIDLEPVYALSADVPYPLDAESAQRRGLEEAALMFGAMIYGWSFSYDIGELARGIPESFELTPVGTIAFGDPGLFVKDAEVRDMRLHLWADYRPAETQLRRLNMWKAGSVRSAQAIGRSPLSGSADWPMAETADWLAAKKAALEDAARTAVRAMLRGSERNRPKEARGFISLSAFPAYWIDGGYWVVSARFKVDITEIQPFAVY